MVEYLPPLVVNDAVLMDVFKNLDLVSPPVDVKSVLVPDESVVSSRLRNLILVADSVQTTGYRLS